MCGVNEATVAHTEPFSPDTLTRTLFRASLDQPTRELFARTAFNGDPSSRKQADQAVEGTLNVRHPRTRKVSVDKRASCFARRMQPGHASASLLFVATRPEYRQDLLRSLLDELQIPDDNGLVYAEPGL